MASPSIGHLEAKSINAEPTLAKLSTDSRDPMESPQPAVESVLAQSPASLTLCTSPVSQEPSEHHDKAAALPCLADRKSPLPNRSSSAPQLPTINRKPTIPIERPGARKRRSRHSSSFKGFADPSFHEKLYENGASIPKDAYHYKRADQWRRLALKSSIEWIVTFILCLSIGMMILGYRQWENFDSLQKRIFNSLNTGLAIALGQNLSSSLSSYAKMMRWRMLATHARPLSEFHLVLGCDSLRNVARLIFRKHSHPSSWKVRAWAVMWILINIATTVLVAIIGLTYSISANPLADTVTVNGFVSTPDWPTLLEDWNGRYAGLQVVQSYGANGMLGGFDSQSLSREGQYDNYFESVGHISRYWFWDANPNDYGEWSLSYRYVESVASCDAFPVLEGQWGNLSYIIYENADGNPVNKSLAAQTSSGGVSFTALAQSECGPRCVNISAATTISRDPIDSEDRWWNSTRSQYFECVNTLSQVEAAQREPNLALYAIGDAVARMLAGGISWSGASHPEQSVYYPETTPWLYNDNPSFADTTSTDFDADTLAQLISQFSVAAIYEITENSNVNTKNVTGNAPVYAQQLLLEKDWYVKALLGIIPGLHLITLVAVLWWANTAVIKDDGHLSTARLLRSLVERLQDKGSMMQSEELIHELHDVKVIYGWEKVEGQGATTVRRLDVVIVDDMTQVGKKFEEGYYI